MHILLLSLALLLLSSPSLSTRNGPYPTTTNTTRGPINQYRSPFRAPLTTLEPTDQYPYATTSNEIIVTNTSHATVIFLFHTVTPTSHLASQFVTAVKILSVPIINSLSNLERALYRLGFPSTPGVALTKAVIYGNEPGVQMELAAWLRRSWPGVGSIVQRPYGGEVIRYARWDFWAEADGMQESGWRRSPSRGPDPGLSDDPRDLGMFFIDRSSYNRTA